MQYPGMHFPGAKSTTVKYPSTTSSKPYVDKSVTLPTALFLVLTFLHRT